MGEISDTVPLQPPGERASPTGTFRTTFGTVLSCIGCMVGTGNIWRFPRILANNSGNEGCLQFMIIWAVFLFIWSIPLILIEYGTGRYTKKATVLSFKELIGVNNAWAGAWICVVVIGISGYYSVILGWCIYYLFYFMGHGLPDNPTVSNETFIEFAQDSNWPVLFHFISILLVALSILWGVKSIEIVNSIIVSIFLVLIVICFIWSLTLPYAGEGLKFMFTPDWDQFGEARMWIDAISQNAFDTGAAAGLFVSYAAYMTASTGIVRYGVLVPIGNNLVSLICGMLTFSTVFSNQLQNGTNFSDIVDLLKENGPANTGLTFIWFPIFFEQIAGGRFLIIIFFLALVFAGLSSLVANVELFVHNVEDMGLKRKFATPLCSLIIFLLGLGSSINLNFLINQDFVWGFGLLVSGLMFLYLVIRYGVKKFRRELYNEYSLNDWHLPFIWDWIVLVVAPVEAVVLIVWWAVDTISNPDQTWYKFTPESFMATIVQWVGYLLIVITINIIYVKLILPRRTATAEDVLNFKESPEIKDKVNSQSYQTFNNYEDETRQ